jgi:hypothetical protein
MSVKLYKLYCQMCNWQLVTDGSDEAAKKLVEIKTSPIPTGLPKIDEETKKIVTPPPKKQIKRFKCPKCGRGIRPVKIEDVQDKINTAKDIGERIEGRNEEDWSVGRKEGSQGLPLPGVPSLDISEDLPEGIGQIPI